MIGLVRLLPPSAHSAGTIQLDRLPELHPVRFSGFIVRASAADEAEEVVDWYMAMRSGRPGIPLGLISPPPVAIEPVAKCRFPIEFVLPPSELIDGNVPVEALEQVRGAAVEGQILGELIHERGTRISAPEHTITTLIAHAVRGGTVASAAADLGVTRETVTRRVGGAGIRARRLMSWARLRAFDIRVELGWDRNLALGACGWMSHEARRKAAARLRQSGGSYGRLA